MRPFDERETRGALRRALDRALDALATDDDRQIATALGALLPLAAVVEASTAERVGRPERARRWRLVNDDGAPLVRCSACGALRTDHPEPCAQCGAALRPGPED